MKLLIVDDEKLTREGLIHEIDWTTLGISDVYDTDDGINALKIIKEEHPDIVLTDVRMPRMDGIVMAETIQEEYKDISVIFMSGYSDKEYLKAAIRLKVIRYVEKPLDVSEVEKAIKEAMENHDIFMRQQYSEKYHHIEQRGRLAQVISHEFSFEKEEVQKLYEDLQLEIDNDTRFWTMIVKLIPPVVGEEILRTMLQEFIVYAQMQKRKVLYIRKEETLLVMHIYTNARESKRVDEFLCQYWKEKLSGKCHFFLTKGESVRGIMQVFRSYNQAVILLQSSFFQQVDSVLERDRTEKTAAVLDNQSGALKEAIRKRNISMCKDVEEKIWNSFQGNQNLLPSQVKDIYYKYFMLMDSVLQKNYALQSTSTKENDTIWGSIAGCETLQALHQLFVQRIDILFQELNKETNENPVILQIKDFVRKNCGVETLSVKDIGDHVYLSPSYVCTLFKTETGKTLNQYITEYRMERAKEMLEDLRYKISEVSVTVGYSDGNYFGKIFKKKFGLSPSEYREKMKE